MNVHILKRLKCIYPGN